MQGGYAWWKKNRVLAIGRVSDVSRVNDDLNPNKMPVAGRLSSSKDPVTAKRRNRDASHFFIMF